MVKRAEGLLELIHDFVAVYDQGRKMSKKLYNAFIELIETGRDYNFTWEMNADGDIVDDNGNVLFVFELKKSLNASIIKHVPDMFQAALECVGYFNNCKSCKQKPVYQTCQKIYKSILDYT